MTRLGETLEAVPEDERPDKVMLVVQTDGLENASTDCDTKRVGWHKVRLAGAVPTHRRCPDPPARTSRPRAADGTL